MNIQKAKGIIHDYKKVVGGTKNYNFKTGFYMFLKFIFKLTATTKKL